MWQLILPRAAAAAAAGATEGDEGWALHERRSLAVDLNDVSGMALSLPRGYHASSDDEDEDVDDGVMEGYIRHHPNNEDEEEDEEEGFGGTSYDRGDRHVTVVLSGKGIQKVSVLLPSHEAL